MSLAYIPPILQPYFHEAFPQSTLAHLCFSIIVDFLKRFSDTQSLDLETKRLLEQVWEICHDTASAALDNWTRFVGQ